MATPPFDIPELLRRISLFVTVKDALSCVVVAKSWSDHFMSVIWFDIDFNIRHRFAYLLPDIITKHRHRIRLVNNAVTPRQVAILNNPSVDRLRNHRLETTASTAQHFNRPPAAPTNKRDSLVHHVFISALIPLSVNPPPKSPLGLTVLIIHNMYLTHDDLVSILQANPSLTELRLFGTDLIRRRSTGVFQHTGVTHFALWTCNIVEVDHDSTAHSTPPSSSSSLVEKVAVFDKLFNIDLEADEVAEWVKPRYGYSGSAQFIPRSCPRLEELDLYAHEMDMDEVEKEEWVCKELKTLRIRVKGLDTKEAIRKAIDLWRAGCKRRRQKEEDEEMEEVEGETKGASIPVAVMQLEGMDLSIEARVARHLLKFENLEEVCLGHKTWTST